MKYYNLQEYSEQILEKNLINEIEKFKTKFNDLKTEIKSKHFNDKVYQQSIINLINKRITEVNEDISDIKEHKRLKVR